MRYITSEDSGVVEHTEDGQILAQSTKIGYVFYYPDLGENGLCMVIEADPDASPEMRAELAQFEEWICKMLYAINERKKLKASSKSRAFLAEQEKRCSNYCIQTDLSVLVEQSNIANIFFDENS